MLEEEVWELGLFDVFVSEETCPNCREKVEMGFQTKALLNCLFRWKKGEIVEAGELIIKDGMVKDCLASCPNCKVSIMGDVVVDNQKFLRVENLRVREGS